MVYPRLRKVRWVRVHGMSMSTGGPAKPIARAIGEKPKKKKKKKPGLWRLPKEKRRKKARPVSIMKTAKVVGKKAKYYRFKYFQRKKKTMYG